MEKLMDNEFKNVVCIYKIMNNKTGRVYIGSTTNLKHRINSHYTHLANNKHYNTDLQKDWNIYESKSFSFKILELINNRDNLPKAEKKYIDEYKNINGVYNKSDPTEENIHIRYKPKLKLSEKYPVKEGTIFIHTQTYIFNYINEKFKNLIESMKDHAATRIYYCKNDVDQWIISNIDDNDIKNDTRILKVLHKWYNKNGFAVTTSQLYKRELRTIFGITIAEDIEILLTTKSYDKLYLERKKRYKKGK
ncbi:GIY-YIG nuclease family protein [Peribacillus asahii]|nr:GIY-YIG nuclease family protein [Peribacillus asahii]